MAERDLDILIYGATGFVGRQCVRYLAASSAARGLNRVTTKCVCEPALGLALDGEALPGGPRRGGLLTPATALGDVLVRRSRDAGMTLAVR